MAATIIREIKIFFIIVFVKSLSIKFKHFHILYRSFLYSETESRPYQMEALDSSRSGIDDQHSVPLRIAHDLQDMRMTAYEYIWMISVKQLASLYVISSRIASDMSHKDMHTLTFEESVERMDESKFMVVAISRNSSQRLESSDFLGQLHASSEISGMPDFIHGLKELADPGVKDSMGI